MWMLRRHTKDVLTSHHDHMTGESWVLVTSHQYVELEPLQIWVSGSHSANWEKMV